MRLVWVGLLFWASGCVLDRTGQSVTSATQRELAMQASRVVEAERLASDVERRVLEMEEVLRYQGKKEAEKLENLDQVILEIRRLRGELEVVQHTMNQSGSSDTNFREDAAYRLERSELRVEAIEKMLGLEPPPMPAPQNTDFEESEPETPSGGVDEVGEGADLFDLGKKHLEAGRNQAARAVFERFMADQSGDERIEEARYRLAESYFADKLYQQAILKMEDVVTADPGSDWAAWAMVRQGECFRGMGKAQEAELWWEDVLAKHPDTEAAKAAKSLLGR
ncbi:MAG: tetratricopeptide repeat protein [Myxococcota bacterium]|nr:tetratricopeptide repeat protein [Myxococcota bacterium]